MKARQGRIAEGEADVRRALLSRLKANGKYNLGTNNHGRPSCQHADRAGPLRRSRAAHPRADSRCRQTLGVPEDAQIYANSLEPALVDPESAGPLGRCGQGLRRARSATKSWEPARREGLQLNSEHIATLYNTNNLKVGLVAAERLLARQKLRFGEQHVDTALSRGLLAIGFARSGRDADALREFKLAVPILMARSRETDDEDATTAAAREQRAQIVVEAYMALLARMGSASGVDAGGRELPAGRRGARPLGAARAGRFERARRRPPIRRSPMLVRKIQDTGEADWRSTRPA